MVSTIREIEQNALLQQAEVSAALKPGQPRWVSHVALPDRYERKFENQNENSGRFSWLTAGGKLALGICSPILSVVKHPLQAAVVLGGGALLATMAPITIPLMAIGGGVIAGIQFAKGTTKATTRYLTGDGQGAMNAFEEIGAGLSGFALTLIGLKSGAAATIQSKAEVEAFATGADGLINMQKASHILGKAREAIHELGGKSYGQLMRENLSNVFSKRGLKALGEQLKPASLGNRYIASLRNVVAAILEQKGMTAALQKNLPLGEAIASGLMEARAARQLTHKQLVREILTLMIRPEGRATLQRLLSPRNLWKTFQFKQAEKAAAKTRYTEWRTQQQATPAELEAIAIERTQTIAKEMGIPVEHLPETKVETAAEMGTNSGVYTKDSHRNTYNSDATGPGKSDLLDDTIAHELAHTQRALQRAGLTIEEINEAVFSRLEQRIAQGEKQPILSGMAKDADGNMFPLFRRQDTTVLTPQARAKLATMLREKLVAHIQAEAKASHTAGAIKLREAVESQFSPRDFEALLHGENAFLSLHPNRESALADLSEYMNANLFRAMYHRMDAFQRPPNLEIKVGSLNEADKASAIRSAHYIMEINEGTMLCRLTPEEVTKLGFHIEDGFMSYYGSAEEIEARINGTRYALREIAKDLEGLNPADPKALVKYKHTLAKQQAYETELEVNELLQEVMTLQEEAFKTPGTGLEHKIAEKQSKINQLVPFAYHSMPMPLYKSSDDKWERFVEFNITTPKPIVSYKKANIPLMPRRPADTQQRENS